jgi:hypothetical protein
MPELPGRIYSRSRWRTATVRAGCRSCDWQKAGNLANVDRGMAAVAGAAKRHVLETGHEVWVDRVQTQWHDHRGVPDA